MSSQQQQGVPERYSNLLGNDFKTIGQTIDESVAIVENARSGTRKVFPTKWEKLNRNLLGGLQPGKLYIIAGRPGVGKSAFSNQMIFDVLSLAETGSVVLLYWSFEMPGYQQLMRISANETSLNLSQLLSVNETLSEQNFRRYSGAVNDFRNYPIYFMNRARDMIYVNQVNKDMHRQYPNVTVINLFDHSRLVLGREDTELRRLINLSHTCMEMQSSCQCINIVLSQLNREIEKPERRIDQFQPMLSDLFGSDSLGQDAHVVMMLNRPHDLYDITESYNDHDPVNLLACHVEKNRDGILGMLAFDADLEHFRIEERNTVGDSGTFGQ